MSGSSPTPRSDTDITSRSTVGSVVQAEFTADRRRGRNLHRAGDLELEAVEKLDGGGHSAGIQLGVEAQRAQPGLLEQCGSGQSVVARADDDRVKVRHRLRLTRAIEFCQ